MIVYPRAFSSQAKAKIVAAEIRALREASEPSVLLSGPRFIPGTTFRREASGFFQYILTVFAAYAHEACELGRNGKWSADVVDREAREGLRMIVMQAQSKFDSSKHHFPEEMATRLEGVLKPDVQRFFEKSPEWIAYQDELLAVTETKPEDDSKSFGRSIQNFPLMTQVEPKKIGQLLEETTIKQSISHEELANRIGISRSSYFAVKAGGGGKKSIAKVRIYLSSV